MVPCCPVCRLRPAFNYAPPSERTRQAITNYETSKKAGSPAIHPPTPLVDSYPQGGRNMGADSKKITEDQSAKIKGKKKEHRVRTSYTTTNSSSSKQQQLVGGTSSIDNVMIYLLFIIGSIWLGVFCYPVCRLLPTSTFVHPGFRSILSLPVCFPPSPHCLGRVSFSTPPVAPPPPIPLGNHPRRMPGAAYSSAVPFRIS